MKTGSRNGRGNDETQRKLEKGIRHPRVVHDLATAHRQPRTTIAAARVTRVKSLMQKDLGGETSGDARHCLVGSKIAEDVQSVSGHLRF